MCLLFPTFAINLLVLSTFLVSKFTLDIKSSFVLAEAGNKTRF